MWSFEHSEETKAKSSDVWRLYSDVSTWPRWDHGVEWVKLEGPFTQGTRGRMKPLGGEPVGIHLTEAVENERFSDETTLPQAVMRFEHTLTRGRGGKTRITHRVVIDGPLAELYVDGFGKKVATGLPLSVKALARLAEQP
ncbi:SRPBCC family protein [Myxococcus sp. RHSTA-1-4]|uniref:SRPBCC family protein n=1 Tax=Myxococcus sp. RHSTA-1-4 TaxID=2874601 RepID=UPI001CBCFE8A|nr:SRPBCC family protein [Myxococcus sp. RHSTA-1-4]MBZ4417195.1 SRPBCC family protein [Myxococcus sp. RHSTA-1-4]